MLFRTLVADLKVLLLADGQRTRGSVAVRDLMDVKRSQSMIWLCLMPILLFAMVIQGWHAHLALAEGHATPDVWQLALFNGISGGLTADSGFFAWLFYGASFVFPIFFVAFFVGLVWDMIFSRLRKETVQEGHLVVAILFALMLPVTIPLWLVAIGMSFAVVVGKQIFGGLGVVSGHPVEKLYREIRPLRLYEGASEVQKIIIARQALSGLNQDPAGAGAGKTVDRLVATSQS